MVYLTGDVHGFHNLKQRLSQFLLFRKRQEEDILIVLGDFGLLWDRKTYGKQVKGIELFISKNLPNFTLAFLDGNHENFDLLKELPKIPKWGGEVGEVSKNIFRLHTGYVYEIEGESYAVYGGAFSIDRGSRTLGVDWWEEEIPNNTIFSIMSESLFWRNFKVDYLLTHTCSETEMWLIDRYPFTDKLHDPVARDIKVIKDSLEIVNLHAFGHMHIDKDLVEEYKLLAMYEDFYMVKRSG